MGKDRSETLFGTAPSLREQTREPLIAKRIIANAEAKRPAKVRVARGTVTATGRRQVLPCNKGNNLEK